MEACRRHRNEEIAGEDVEQIISEDWSYAGSHRSIKTHGVLSSSYSQSLTEQNGVLFFSLFR